MDIIIRKLSPELIDDYLHFFDVTPHSERPDEDECKCYCVWWCAAEQDPDNIGYLLSREKRRGYAAQAIRENRIQGYLAYNGDKVVGWCNANTKADCLQCFCWRRFMGHVPADGLAAGVRVKSVFCFLVAPEFRRQGVTKLLLQRVCEDAARDGFDFVEAYPGRDFISEAKDCAGPVGLYMQSGFEVRFENEGQLVMRKGLSKINIRNYNSDDEIALKGMLRNANHNYTENLDEYLANVGERETLTVAEYSGVVAGYLWLSIQPGNCQAFIFVSPERRRRGVGTALCDEAARLCREKDEKEFWAMYYEYEIGRGFADKVGCYYTASSIYMEYAGGALPDCGKFKNIRECREEDYFRCAYLWDKGYYEMQVRIGHPDPRMYMQCEDDRHKFVSNTENSYVIEEDGQIIAYGVISGNAIGALAVDTELSNRGYGTALTELLTNEILKRGNANAYLWCEAENANARHVYEKIGYKKIEMCYTSYKRTM